MEVDQISVYTTGKDKFSDLDILFRRKSYFAPEGFEHSDENLGDI